MLSRDEYENKLAGLGCQQIGSGLYSNVFSVPHRADLAIKVADLDAWPVYIQWATKNGHNGKFAPMVYSLKFHDCYYVALMERLVCTIKEIKYPDNGAGVNPIQIDDYRAISRFPEPKENEGPVDLVAFYKELQAIKLSGDLHDGNVMVRHDGQLVVTDPCSSNFTSDRFRIRRGTCP